MIDLRAINQAQFISAKRYWTAAIIVKLVIFGLGVWAVFLTIPPTYLPQILLVLAILSEGLQLRSDGLKGQAEALLRTLDICRSFGREISEADKRDIVVNIPRAFRKRFAGKQASDTYFISTRPDGPQKAISNLLESAWYTKHQARIMTVIYFLLIAGLLTLSISALVVALREISNPQLREQVVKVVTAWLLLIVSLSMLKSAWSYFKMYQRCQKTEITCNHLLLTPILEADALKQWYEYQIARASSPLLPGWLWRVVGPSLDDAWRRASEEPH